MATDKHYNKVVNTALWLLAIGYPIVLFAAWNGEYL
jgi:hypothetical protein